MIAYVYKKHTEEDNEESNDNDDDDDNDGDEGISSNSRKESISRMSQMSTEGVPESVYRSIEAKRLQAPKTGVKVKHLSLLP